MSTKRRTIKKLIQQYYVQLTEGCGKEDCTNDQCASNSSFIKLNANDAAAKAITLCKNKSGLCVNQQTNKIPKTENVVNGMLQEDSFNGQEHGESSVSTPFGQSPSTSFVVANNTTTTLVNLSQEIVHQPQTKLVKEESVNQKLKNFAVTETTDIDMAPENNLKLLEYFETLDKFCESTANGIEDFTILKQAIWKVFSSFEAINRFAVVKETLKSQISIDEDKDVMDMSVDSIEPQVDMDVEPCASTSKASEKDIACQPTVNMGLVRSLYAQCSKHHVLEPVMYNAVSFLVDDLTSHSVREPDLFSKSPNCLNVFPILMENYALHNPQAYEKHFPSLLKLLSKLSITHQAALARFWSQFEAQHLINIVESIQQLITVRVVMEYDSDDEKLVQQDSAITAAAKSLNIIYYASLLGGEMSSAASVDKELLPNEADVKEKSKESKKNDENPFFSFLGETEESPGFEWNDPLGKKLNVNVLDSTQAKISHQVFINEALNNCNRTDQDYAFFRLNKVGTSKFSFLHYPFMLNTVNKTACLFYDNRCRMSSERRRTFVSSFMQGALVNPYLKIQVRRSHIIDDALVQLEMAAENSSNFKKQLFVEFDGEEGVDEGGVSKEFFQLVVEQIFNPDNGMFTYNKDTSTFWFNQDSFENQIQFKLIGIVLGLAIYNSCILDISFPTFIYKKLLGGKAMFNDMVESHPMIYKSLKSILEHDGNVEEDLMLNFDAQYENVFGESVSHNLLPDGENIPVTNANRQQYVDLYTDWLLNESISEQFDAFSKGFNIVIKESPIKHLFRFDELELLIRGSENYNFNELELGTEYDGGFSKDSQTIKDFWSVVHEMSDEDKKKLLQFSTGSDRAPVGGLSKLKMVIAKNGPDSSRLPTSHTCFNVILLPDYKDRNKLKERLLKAISYSKGFGML